MVPDIDSPSAFLEENDEDGWHSLADQESSASCVQSKTQPQAGSRDSDLDLELDAESGWEEIATDEVHTVTPGRLSVGSLLSEAPGSCSSRNSQFSNAQPKKQGRGRPKGTHGSAEFRQSMRLAVSKFEAQAQETSQDRGQILARAREAKLKKAQNKHGFSSPIFRDSHPDVGTDLELWAHSAALSILENEIRTVETESGGQGHSGDSASGFQLDSYMSKLFNSADHVAVANASQSMQTPESLDQDDLTRDRNTLAHIFKEYRGYCSVARDADGFNMTPWRFSHNLIRSASALKVSSSKLWANMLCQLKSLLSTSHDGALLICKYRFDETPSRIRVQDLQAVGMPGSGIANKANSKGSLAKILQTEFSVVVLLKKKIANGSEAQGSDFLMLTGTMPTPLQVLDRQTARNLKMALEDSMKLPGLEDLAEQFTHRMFLFSTDEFSSNSLAEFCMQACRPSKWLRLATFCDIHKMATAQGKVFELTQAAISAVINMSLSMVASGSVSKLQSFVCDIITSKFQLRIGKPELSEDAQRYSKEVLDIFLSVPDDFAVSVSDAVSSRQRLKYTTRLKQRVVIEHFCNGDMRDTSTIAHWAQPGEYVDEDHALQTFLKYMVPVLVPCACPMFPRSRWFGADAALDYLGLWSVVHGILPDVVAAWCGREIPKPPAQQESILALEDGSDDDGWGFEIDAKLGSEVLKVVGKAPLEDLVPAEAEEPAAQEQDPEHAPQDGEEARAKESGEQTGFDFHAYHRRLKTSVFEWIFRDVGSTFQGPLPATQLVLMRQYMGPILKGMSTFLFISSKRWNREQLLKVARGEPRQYRMLLAYQCEEPLRVIQRVVHLLLSPPSGLMDSEWRKDISLLCFQMLSRLGCCIHQLMCWRLRRYPYKLFSALLGSEQAKAIFEESRCLQDEVTQSLCEKFGSPEMFSSTECLKLIETIAIHAETDIGPIERQHTISRKVIQTRSLTHPVALQTLSADWLVRQFVQYKTDMFTYLYFDSTSAVRKLKRKQQRNLKKTLKPRKRRGGGGAFRAFVSHRARGRVGRATAAFWKETAKEYGSLSQEQKQFFTEVGALGTKTHQHGFHAFGPQPPKRNRTPNHSALLLNKPQSSPFAPLAADANSDDNPGTAVVPHGEDPHEFRLQIFSQDQLLKDRFSQIRKAGIAVHQKVDHARSEALEVFSQFVQAQAKCDDDSSAATASILAIVEDASPSYPGSQMVQKGCVPKPSPIPWLEWVPPCDIFAKAWKG